MVFMVIALFRYQADEEMALLPDQIEWKDVRKVAQKAVQKAVQKELSASGAATGLMTIPLSKI